MPALRRPRWLGRALASPARPATRRGEGGDGLLSVVLPIHDAGPQLRGALESVLGQSYPALEVVVVDDGSPDRSAAIAREIAAHDSRVRLVSRRGFGPGAARNAGAASATGKFIAFCDPDGLVLPGAYQEMVAGLAQTGADFASGTLVRGDGQRAVRPTWLPTPPGEDAYGVTLVDHPEAMLDTTSANKVFRRDFWSGHGLRFPEDTRHIDLVPVTAAVVQARAFNVHRRKVYQARADGPRTSRRAASTADLADRLAAQARTDPLLEGQTSQVREHYYLRILAEDLAPYLEAALTAEPGFVDMVCGRLEVIRAQAPPGVWTRIRFPTRALAWLLSERRLDAALETRIWLLRQPGGRATRVEDEDVVFEPPPRPVDAGLPVVITRVHEVDVRPVVRLTEVRWDQNDLVLRGSAYLTPLGPELGQHRLRVALVDREGRRFELPVSRFTEPRLDWLSGRSRTDHSSSGFEVRLDAERLAAESSRQRVLSFEFTQTQGRFTSQGSVTDVLWQETGGARDPRIHHDQMVRPVGNAGTGLKLQVHESWARAASAQPRAHGVELGIVGSRLDPPVGFFLGRTDELPSAPGDLPGTFLVQVDPQHTDVPLFARHRSGRRTAVLWGMAPSAVTVDGGAFVHRAELQGVTVGPRRAAVLITAVGQTPSGLVLEGTSAGAQGARLVLQGDRATGTGSAPLPEGPFQVELPLTTERWGLGPRALPEGQYELVGTSGPELRLKADAAVRDRLPLSRDGEQHLGLGVGRDWSLLVTAAALSQEEGSARRQHRLRTGSYAEARRQPRRDVVLLESFGGTSSGDSPAEIGKELLRRYDDLEVVWSVIDGSVPAPDGMRAVVRESAEWFDLLGRAAYLVNNNNFPWYFQKAPGQVYLQTWHGTPLKRIANDIPDRSHLSVNYQRTMHDEARAWDYLVSPSPYCSAIFPRAFGFGGELLEHGYPRNDPLTGPEVAGRGAEVRRRLGIAAGQQVVLYAPTWRDGARARGSFAKILHLQPDVVTTHLPDTVLLVRGHSNTAASAAVAGGGSGRVVDVTLYPDLNDLFLASDVLVTDYSSVMFDYAVLDRPIALLVPDLEDYRDRLRGFYFDFETAAPGPLIAHQGGLLDHLDVLRSGADPFAPARDAFRTRFAPWDDGRAAARVVDAVFGARSTAAQGHGAR